MIGERLHAPGRRLVQIAFVDDEDARPGAIHRRHLVLGAGAALLERLGHAVNRRHVLRGKPEILRHTRIHLSQYRLIARQELRPPNGAVRHVVTRVLLQLLHACGDSALLDALRIQDRLHLLGDACNLGEPQRVQLLGAVMGGGHLMQHRGIEGCPVRQTSNARALRCGGGTQRDQGDTHAQIRGIHLLRDGVDGFIVQLAFAFCVQILDGIHARIEARNEAILHGRRLDGIVNERDRFSSRAGGSTMPSVA